jgi:hypothetical protein
MKCPKCGFQPIKQTDECPKCGIIFHKYLKLIKNSSSVVSFKNQTTENKIDKTAFIKELFFYIKPEVNPLSLGARALFFMIMLIWGLKFILSPLDFGYAGMRWTLSGILSICLFTRPDILFFGPSEDS